jgi:DNA repair exonuclease SbcCD nuclease subunit
MNVGLLHCSVLSSIRKEDKYLPTTMEELSNKKYDYWALGHIHKREKVNEEIYYSGSLQGLNSKETGIKGGLLIDLNNDYKVVKFIEFGVIDYIDIEINFSEANINSKNNLIDYIEEKIKIKKESIIKLYFFDKTIIFDYLNNENNQDEIKGILLKNELILDIQIDVSKMKKKIDYKEYIRNNNILGYIEKNYNNKEIAKRIMNENKIKEIDDNILEKIFDKMVSDQDEI